MGGIPAFGPWSENDHIGQRQENAIKAAQTAKISPMPGTVDTETQTAVFWGSGRDMYQTTLASCTCGAFRGTAPCKHIYRLAMELGIIHLPYRTGTPKGELLQTQMHWRDAVEEIEKLPDGAQFDIMRSYYCGTIESGGTDAEAMRACPLLEETGGGSFRMIDNLTTARGTVIRYLRQKYDWDIDPLTGERYPHGSYLAADMKFHFSDDYIAKELTRRGHNRCLNGYRPEPEKGETK